MNNDKGKIYYGISLDTSDLKKGAAESKRILSGIGDSAVEEGERIDDVFKRIGTAAAGLFAAAQIKSFVTEVAHVRGEFQKLEIAFKTMLGSEEKAVSLMDQLVRTAATTPFGMTDIANSAKQLLAYGFEAEKVNETLIRLGDIAAGLSIPINDLSALYGKTMVQGRLYADDLNQFLGRGIPLMSELAAQFGVAESEVKKLVEEGKVGFPEVQKAIENLTNEGSKFGGLMEAQSKTIAGQISNIEDSIEQMFNEIGKKSEGVISDTLSLTSSIIENWEKIGKVLLTVIATYGTYKAAVLAVAAAHKLMAIWGTVQAFISLARYVKTAKDAVLLFNMAVKANPLGLVLSVVAAAATAFSLFKDSTDEATEAVKAQKEAAEEFNRQVSESAGQAISAYKQLEKEYKNCKTAHEKREWIQENKRRFDELGIAVTDVNTAENVFVKNTALMMEAFKKRAEAAAWQSKIDAEYAKRVERQLVLDKQREHFEAGAVVYGSSHTTEGGNEYVDRNGRWVYTQKGADAARAAFDKNIKNDPVLNEIDARIEKYASKMETVSGSFRALFEQAGTSSDGGKKDDDKGANERQKLLDEAADRKAKIQEYGQEIKEEVSQAELDIRQAQINAMEDGYEKTVAQIDLNYDRLMAQNLKRENEMKEALKDKMMLEWADENPNATKEQTIKHRESLNVDRSDLSVEQQKTLVAYEEIAKQIRIDANKAALEEMLKDIRTYEQQRSEIEKEYADARAALYTQDSDGNTVLRDGVTQENVDELNRQEAEALALVDEQFASREEAYQAWCNQIANLSLEQLEEVLRRAEEELKKLEASGGSESSVAVARAKVNTARNSLSKTKAKSDVTPNKRSIKEWEDLYKVLNECNDSFEEIGDTVGGVAGEIISAAGGIMSSTLSMVNGIVQLVQMSASGVTGTATAAATAISTMEKASVILTIISAALQVAMAIVNLFNNDDKKEEEIEALQGRIDQLQWELDNADIVRLQENRGKAIDMVRRVLHETYLELVNNRLAVNDVAGAWMMLFSTVSNNQELLAKSADKLATAYGNVAYTADKALGGEQFASSREQLENISQQQLLIQEQINQEKDKKKTDWGRIEEWETEIEELGAQAVQIINDMVEEIIGGSSVDIANQLADAFFEAFEAGEDAAEAWGEKVNEIVADITKRMLISKFLEEPLGEVFDKYKQKWFKDGQFVGLDVVIESMSGFANDLNAVGADFAEIWETLPDSVKGMFEGTAAAREASEKGIATASQESVDELNGRMTAVQGHTYSICENTKTLLATATLILQSVLNIEDNTDKMNTRMEAIESGVKDVRDTVNDIALKGIKIK